MAEKIVMDAMEMIALIKTNLRLETEDHDLKIFDWICEVCSYCNLPETRVPIVLEPFIRKKVQAVIDYEAMNGPGYHPEVAQIKEGDGSITWAQTEGNTKASIYNLSEPDKKDLRRFRRLRGYA